MKNKKMTMPSARLPALLFASLLRATTPLLHVGRLGTPSPYARDLATAPLVAGPAVPTAPAPQIRSRLFAAREATTAAADAPATDAAAKARGATSKEWMPPSRNVEQRRGNIFIVREPEDLLDFVIEDDQLSVVKVYASWCKTCKMFDLRYRKLASQFGHKYDASQQLTKGGRARFAEMELKGDNEQILKALLPRSKQPISLPYILMYKEGKMVRNFRCTPKTFRTLADAVEELAAAVDAASEGSLQRGKRRGVDGGDVTADATTAQTAAVSMGKGLGVAQSYLSSLGTQ